MSRLAVPPERANRFYIFSLILLSLILGFLGFRVLSPFLSPLAWGMVLSIVFYPFYVYVEKLVKWRSVASAVTLAVILVIILGPVSYLSVLLVQEMHELAAHAEKSQFKDLRGFFDTPEVAWVLDRIGRIFNIGEADLGNLLANNISDMGRQLVGQVTKGVRNIFATMLNFVFMAFSTFFLLRDGPMFIKRMRDYLPFSEEQKDRLEHLTKGMVVSVIFGGVVVALVQGLIGGTAFYFLGIKTPVVWGTAIAIMSFVPVLGTFSVWGPITAYLFLDGEIAKGFIMLIVGTFGISLVDNILKPIIIGGRTKMPTLLIFFGVIGGIRIFGPIGIVMGPLVIALFISVLEIFRNIEGGSDA